MAVAISLTSCYTSRCNENSIPYVRILNVQKNPDTSNGYSLLMLVYDSELQTIHYIYTNRVYSSGDEILKPYFEGVSM